MKTKRRNTSGTSGTHDLFIKIIFSPSKSRDTIPLSKSRTAAEVRKLCGNINSLRYCSKDDNIV